MDIFTPKNRFLLQQRRLRRQRRRRLFSVERVRLVATSRRFKLMLVGDWISFPIDEESDLHSKVRTSFLISLWIEYWNRPRRSGPQTTANSSSFVNAETVIYQLKIYSSAFYFRAFHKLLSKLFVLWAGFIFEIRELFRLKIHLLPIEVSLRSLRFSSVPLQLLQCWFYLNIKSVNYLVLFCIAFIAHYHY